MKINMTDEYTINDRDVRIVCVDREGNYPVIGYYKDTGCLFYCMSNGTCTGVRNLVKKPKLVERWVNMYEGGEWVAHETEQKAKDSSTSGCLRVAVHLREVV